MPKVDLRLTYLPVHIVFDIPLRYMDQHLLLYIFTVVAVVSHATYTS